MDGLLTIISSATSLNKNHYPKLITALQNHQSFSQKASHELDATVSLITNYLNNVELRHEGLLLLRAFILQCPIEIIEQKGGLWITLCTKSCIQDKNAAAVNIAYDVIKCILEKSVDIPELSKSIASSLLSKIVESVNGVPVQSQLAALKCLETCMKLYPGPCGSSRGHIDRFLSTFVDDVNPINVRQAAKCLHLLQQVRGGNVHGLSQKNAWSLLQSQLIMNLHKTLDQIFANTVESCDEVNYNSNETETFNIKLPELTLSAEPVVRATQLTQRFWNLCQYLRVALSEPFPASKAIQGSKIVSLVSRGLAINCSILAKNAIVDNIALGGLLPEIHVALYQLLNTLILVLGTYLLPYASNICQLVIQTLKWTSSGKASGFARPYSKIREYAYKTLQLWCKTTKYGSLVETVAEDLTKYILQDITPFQSEVTLKVLQGSRKYLSKKARQRLQKSQNDATNLAQTHSKSFDPNNSKIIYSDIGNEQLCAEALNCLNQIILSCGCFLKPVLQKVLQENIVSLSIKTAGTVQSKSNLYHASVCRANLYTVLNSLIISPHHLCPPPVQYAATVFSIVQNSDVNEGIRAQCTDYLRSIEKILHPQKEILYFPTEAGDYWKNAGKKNQLNSDDSCESDEEEDMEIQVSTSVEKVTITSATEELLDDGSNGTILKQKTGNTGGPIEKETITSEDKPNEPDTSSTSDNQLLTKSPNKITVDAPKILTSPERSHEELASNASERLTTPLTSPKRSHEELASNESERLTPPRKSLRLNLVQNSGSGSDQDSLDKPTSGTPRRRSARLSSFSSQDNPKKVDDKSTPVNQRLEKIREEPQQKGDSVNKNEIENNPKEMAESSVKYIDDCVNEMFSEFVGEFIVNTNDKPE